MHTTVGTVFQFCINIRINKYTNIHINIDSAMYKKYGKTL